MRRLQLMESGRARHVPAGVHGLLSLSVHAAIVVAALAATARTPVSRGEPVANPRVHFFPEPRPEASPPAATHRAPQPATRKPAATPRAPMPAAVSVPSSAVPSELPAVDVPLVGMPAITAPRAGDGQPDLMAVDLPGSRGDQPFGELEVEVPAAPLGGSPDYPERARQLGISGTVTARFVVGRNGRVEKSVIIVHASGSQFAGAVRDYLRRARYRPARYRGERVRQLVEQTFIFEPRR